MRNRYPFNCFLLITASIFALAAASCKKDNKNTITTSLAAVAAPTNVGLYEADSAEYRELDIAVSEVGTQSIDIGLVFDTGSGGMVLDADGILPSSMITSSGFNFTGDSTVVNGVTITNQTSTLQYGADSSTLTTVYGNLAYAPVTIGDQSGKVTIKRLPFCLYYKAIDANGNKLEPHYFDTFGVNSEYIYFSGNAYITSPFSYFDPGNGLTKGFKMAQLNTANFSYDGTYVSNAVTLGLTSSDLSPASNFIMHNVSFYPGDGYVPAFQTTVNYSGKSISTYALFDTGTSGYNYIEDPAAKSNISLLPQNSQVTLTTSTGFSYSYTVEPQENLTYVENPNKTGGDITIFGIDFFLNNEYLQNYANQKIGLKND